MAAAAQLDWSVTEEKIAELVRRIVAAVDPLEVIAFGSRARGDHREDSDLDLAVIVEGDERAALRKIGLALGNIHLEVDFIVLEKKRFDEFRPWINTVDREIDREGVRLYERGKKPAGQHNFEPLCAGRALAAV